MLQLDMDTQLDMDVDEATKQLLDLGTNDSTDRSKYDDYSDDSGADSDLDEEDPDASSSSLRKKKCKRPPPHEDVECAKCKHCVYIGCVRCKCDPSQVTCHKHFADFYVDEEESGAGRRRQWARTI